MPDTSTKDASSDFVHLADLSNLVEGSAQTFELGDTYVILVREGDHVYCIDDVCTHDGGTLGDGWIEDKCIVCPRHGAKFDFRTGEAVAMPATEPTHSHDVKIVGGKVLVRLIA
jgi:3-phenylpropionate/trans-cinnamate dioxygenase ferredoxin component